MLLALLALCVAQAQTPEEEPPPEAPPADEGDPTDVRPAPRPDKPPGEAVAWDKKPFVLPVAGASVFTGAGGEPAVSIGLGAQAGLRYWQEKEDPFLTGMSRVRGEYLFGGGLQGPEVRVGSFMGPWWKFVGVQTGPDLFWEKYSFTVDDAKYSLDPTVGMSWPVIAQIKVAVLTVYGGLEPAFYFASDELVPEVDWSEEDRFGFGREFTYQTGATLDLQAISLGVSYSITTSGYGEQSGIGFSIRR